jgi:catechol 2,3-dioxygenase-like lactoylglutathione lyase family enzyme
VPVEPLPPAFAEQITFLFVEDLERSHAFYGGVLALPLALDQGTCRIYRVCGGAYLGVCERPGRVEPEGIIVTLVTGDVEGWHRRLTGGGVPVVRPPGRSDEYRVFHAFYRDPDGYLVETQRFLDPAWDRRPPAGPGADDAGTILPDPREQP